MKEVSLFNKNAYSKIIPFDPNTTVHSNFDPGSTTEHLPLNIGPSGGTQMTMLDMT
jgi:hypothetical protein